LLCKNIREKFINLLIIIKKIIIVSNMGIGDWGLGYGDW
jgi:hypothetical protein